MRLLLVTLLCWLGLASAQTEKRIAITFDDAPRGDGPVFSGPARGEALIAALARAKTGPTAFFVTTQGFDQRADGRSRIAAYAAAGHLIANHSHTHMWLSRNDAKTYLADLDRAEQELEGFENRRAWFRFPFLDEGRRSEEQRDAVRKGLSERGLKNGYVTVDAYDWHLASRLSEAENAGDRVDFDELRGVYVAMIVDAAEHYAHLAEEWLGRQPAHVLLLHENDPAALFIGDAVGALRAAGWEVISPDEAYEDPLADELHETLFSGMGRVSSLAYDRGARGAEIFDHWAADAGEIDRRLKESGALPNLSVK